MLSVTMSEDTVPVVTVGPLATIPTRQQQPSMTAAQRSAAAAVRLEKQKRIESDIEAWFNESMVLAARMSDDYGMSQSHFITQMFQAGAKIINGRKPNVYNAWLHRRASQLNEGECSLRM